MTIRSLKSVSFMLAVVATVACSSSSSSGGSASGACASYVSAMQEGAKSCGRAPASSPRDAEASARFQKFCANALNAPGTGITASVLEQCSAKIRAACGDDSVCEGLEKPGTLADGAACGTDSQCASGDCKNPSGGGCGTCIARIPIGGACNVLPSDNTSASCAENAECQSKGDTGTCVARVTLAAGEVCFDPKASSGRVGDCADGLTCDVSGSSSVAVKCAPRGAAGSTCSSEQGCLSALTCVSGKCSLPVADGAACTESSQCASSACSSKTRTCAVREYVAAGAACNNEERGCARGGCRRSDSNMEGTCVDPLPDGAACSPTGTASCDDFASCINGTCQIFDPSTCK